MDNWLASHSAQLLIASRSAYPASNVRIRSMPPVRAALDSRTFVAMIRYSGRRPFVTRLRRGSDHASNSVVICRRSQSTSRLPRPLRRYFACTTPYPSQAPSGDVENRTEPSKLASRPPSGPSPNACKPGPRT